MIPLLKRASRQGNRGGETGGTGTAGNMELVELREALRVTALVASTKESTDVMVQTEHELHGKSRNMSNIHEKMKC